MANRVKLVPTIGAEIPHLDFTFMVGATPEQAALLRTEDAGKAVKFASDLPDSRVVFCEDGDEINGQLITIEASQTSAGFKVGTVRVINSPMFNAVNAGDEALAVGDAVVAAAQAAPGQPNAAPPYHVVMRVKKAPAPGAGEAAPAGRLRVVAIQSGSGATGSTVTLSRIMH